MGSPHLYRPAVATLLRGRTALLLVLATLVAELVDLVGAAHPHVGPVTGGHAGGELLASVVGLAVAAVAGLLVDRPPTGASQRVRGNLRGDPVAGRAVRVAGALLVALTAHELTAVGLHAEHGAGAGELVVHLAGTVLPLAIALGTLVALLVGTRVVRRVVVAVRRSGAGPVLVVVPPASRLLVVAAEVVPAGLLPALRLVGRGPPVVLR